MVAKRAQTRSGTQSGARRHKASERGVTLYLVVLVLSMLSAIGVFAMRSASLVDVAAGYNRQSVQAAQIAEYGARAAANAIGRNPGLLRGDESHAGCQDRYVANTPGATCRVLKTNTLQDEFAALAPSGLVGPLSGALSATGASTTLNADLPTEYLAPTVASRPAAGFSVASESFLSVVFTSRAQVYPTDATAAFVCAPGTKEALSQQAVRAHVIVPDFNP